VGGMPLRWRVPLAASELAEDWTQLGMDDSEWMPGTVGVGYDTGQNDVPAPGIVTGLTNVAAGKVATQSSTVGSSDAGLAVNGDPSDFTQTLPGENLPASWTVNLGTNHAIGRIILNNRLDCCASRLRDIQVWILNSGETETNFVSAVLNPQNVLGGARLGSGPDQLIVDLIELTGSLVVGGAVRVSRMADIDLRGSGGEGNEEEMDVLSLAEVEVLGVQVVEDYGPFIQTDLESAMSGQNSSAFLRVPFDFSLGGSAPLSRLLLRIQYDDGYIAHLNGGEISSVNAPLVSAWDSAATAGNPNYRATLFEEVDLGGSLSLLQQGLNVLAMHGLNLSKEDPEFLIVPELVGAWDVVTPDRYLASATPGEANTIGFLGVIDEVEFSHAHGFYEESFELSLSCETPGVQIRYTRDGSEPSPTNGLSYMAPIGIDGITVVRAAAFLDGFRPSDSRTRTYLYIEEIIRQTPQTTIASGFPEDWAGNIPDYGMDPDVIGLDGTDNYNGKYAATIRDDLKLIRTISIVGDIDELFGPTGIYSRSAFRGPDFERPISAELIELDGSEGFQVNCGVRLQGSRGLKHSLRLLFRGRYGPTKLRYPLFGEDVADRFDTITLRANSTDGWQSQIGEGRPLFIRDSFTRETHLGMGRVAIHETWVHLYINGVYWGLYNPVERPDAGFSASYFGGDKETWDAIHTVTASNGSMTAWETTRFLASQGLASQANYQRIQGNRPDGTDDPSLPDYLDVENMIDYMIVNMYVGNTDWPEANWWIARRRFDSTGFKFYVWDAEQSLDLLIDTFINLTGTAGSVAAPYAACRANPEFLVTFGDHVHRHFFNGGPFYVDPEHPEWDPEHPERNRPAARFVGLANQVERVLVAESARWGDQYVAVPYTRDEHWKVERDVLLRDFFPRRTAIVLDQFRGVGLYPLVEAPSFNQTVLENVIVRPRSNWNP